MFNEFFSRKTGSRLIPSENQGVEKYTHINEKKYVHLFIIYQNKI